MKIRRNVKPIVVLLLKVIQEYMKDWKGKEAVRFSNKIMNVQAGLMDIEEIPIEEFAKPPQLKLNLFEKEVS